jgi:hypothetical protein
MASSDTIVEKKTKIVDSLKEPGKFKVIVCNDDVTPIEFVISMLISVFRHNEKSALELTLSILLILLKNYLVTILFSSLQYQDQMILLENRTFIFN